MVSTVPPTEPTCHHVADLVRDLRRLAYDKSLADDDRARRIRDRIGEYDGRFADSDE